MGVRVCPPGYIFLYVGGYGTNTQEHKICKSTHISQTHTQPWKQTTPTSSRIHRSNIYILRLGAYTTTKHMRPCMHASVHAHSPRVSKLISCFQHKFSANNRHDKSQQATKLKKIYLKSPVQFSGEPAVLSRGFGDRSLF